MSHRTHIRQVICAVTLALLAAACVQPPPPVNLLSNHSFEHGTELPDSWQRDVFQPTSTLAWDDSVARSGNRSVRIESETPNDSRWIQTVPVQPNTLYELSGWIRTRGVQPSAQAVQAGANLSVMGTFTHSVPLFGDNGWTYRTVRFNSGDSTSVTVAARVGFYSGITTGTAWFDDLRLRPVTTTLPAKWRVLTLIYDRTELTYIDSHGVEQRVVAQMSPEEVNEARNRATQFVTQDLPPLTNGMMAPTSTVRVVNEPLRRLSQHGSGWWPSPLDTASERDPAFDSVIVIWDPRGTNQATGAPQWIGSAAGLTPGMGTGQTYATLIAEAAVSYPHRNVFKHEFGHSLLFYFAALGALPLPHVSNHADEGEYVNCEGGAPYVWVDETEANPIPNSVYNNHSGFTHDYYSGRIAKAEDPTRCIGIGPQVWSFGGPVS